MPFCTRRGFKFTPPRTARFSVLWLCLLGTPRVRDVASVRQYDSDAAHSGTDAPSTDWICILCGRHPHFNAPKYEIAALVLTIRRCPPV
nr:hypothetical protein [uncultured Campylobacter sp.]